MTETTRSRWGWDTTWEEAFAEPARRGHKPARVIAEQRGRYRIVGPEGEQWAQPSGKTRHAAKDPRELPSVGDWIAYEDRKGGAVIHVILPRRSTIVRRASGRKAEPQIVAANVDTVFVMTTLTLEFNARRIERFLAATHESGAAAVVVLNKADLCDEPDEYIDEIVSIARGVPIVITSASTGGGLDALAPWLHQGHTVALLGASGVGKSTLVNALMGETLQETAPVREADHRGRHTTRQRELFQLASGAMLIDTPGLRELEPWDLSGGIQDAFDDIIRLATKCRFRDCQHVEEPGCAVQRAVDRGKLDPFRLDNYHRLLDEADNRGRHWDRASTVIARERMSSTAWSKRG